MRSRIEHIPEERRIALINEYRRSVFFRVVVNDYE